MSCDSSMVPSAGELGLISSTKVPSDQHARFQLHGLAPIQRQPARLCHTNVETVGFDVLPLTSIGSHLKPPPQSAPTTHAHPPPWAALSGRLWQTRHSNLRLIRAFDFDSCRPAEARPAVSLSLTVEPRADSPPGPRVRGSRTASFAAVLILEFSPLAFSGLRR